MPYLPIDPTDVGRTYEAVIRINSQSGKGGVAYVMETDYGVHLPRRLQIDFSQIVQGIADQSGRELTSKDLWTLFEHEYLPHGRRKDEWRFVVHRTVPDTHASEIRALTATLERNGERIDIHGRGNGPIDAFVDAVKRDLGIAVRVMDYREHAVGHGADAVAMAYVEAQVGEGAPLFGVGRHSNIVAASLSAIVSAVNRAARRDASTEAA